MSLRDNLLMQLDDITQTILEEIEKDPENEDVPAYQRILDVIADANLSVRREL